MGELPLISHNAKACDSLGTSLLLAIYTCHEPAALRKASAGSKGQAVQRNLIGG